VTKLIPTWRERCDTHPDHNGVVTSGMIYARMTEEIEDLRAEVERLTMILHEIREEWAGAECGEPVTAQEAYAIGLARRMYEIAKGDAKGTLL